MELFDYSRTETVDKHDHWMRQFFNKVAIKCPGIGDKVKISYTSWGDRFVALEVNDKLVWSGNKSTGDSKSFTEGKSMTQLKTMAIETMAHLKNTSNQKLIIPLNAGDFMVKNLAKEVENLTQAGLEYINSYFETRELLVEIQIQKRNKEIFGNFFKKLYSYLLR